jgi:hypothetical protein
VTEDLTEATIEVIRRAIRQGLNPTQFMDSVRDLWYAAHVELTTEDRDEWNRLMNRREP